MKAMDHPLYETWRSMRSRCYSKNNHAYRSYGGRGIQICDRWREDFWSFVVDVGERPSKGHTLDRIDSDKNYEPGNVRWATRLEQTQNRRSSKTCRRGHIFNESNTLWTHNGVVPTKRCKRCIENRDIDKKRETNFELAKKAVAYVKEHGGDDLAMATEIANLLDAKDAVIRKIKEAP